MSTFLPVEALSSLSAQAQALIAASGTASSGTAGISAPEVGAGFGQLISEGLGQLNSKLMGNQVDLQKLALGETQNLHQVMINLEESRISFQTMMQVRSRFLEAYQDIMKMPL